MSRRGLAFLILACLLAACLTTIDPAAAQELKFGFTPVLSEAEMRAEFEPLMTYLSDAIGQKATLYIAEDSLFDVVRRTAKIAGM